MVDVSLTIGGLTQIALDPVWHANAVLITRWGLLFMESGCQRKANAKQINKLRVAAAPIVVTAAQDREFDDVLSHGRSFRRLQEVPAAPCRALAHSACPN